MSGKLIISFLCLFFINVHTQVTTSTTTATTQAQTIENTSQTNASQVNAVTETPIARGLLNGITKLGEEKQNILSIDGIIDFLTKAVQFLMDPVGTIRTYVKSILLAFRENPIEFVKDLYGKGKKLFLFLKNDLPAQGQQTKKILMKFLQLIKLVGVKSS